MTCLDKFMAHADIPCKFNHYMHACICLARNYPEALSHCGLGHDLTSVARLYVVNIADISCLQYIYSSLAGFTTPLNQSQSIMYDLCCIRRNLLGNEELDHSHFIVLSSVVEGRLQLVVNEVLAEIITFKEYIGNVIVPLCSR